MHAPNFKTLAGRYAAIHVEQQQDGMWASYLMVRMSDDELAPLENLSRWWRKSRSGALFIAKRVAEGYELRIEDRVFVTPYMEA